MSLLAWAAAALAHTPHDVALYVALEPGTGRLATHMPRGERWYAATSEDGLDWRLHLSVDAEPRCGAFTEDGRWLLGTADQGLFVSEDEGASWTRTDLSEGVGALQVRGDRVLAGGTSLQLSQDGGRSFRDLGAFGDEIASFAGECLATLDGELWCSPDEGETWAPWTSLEATVLDLEVQGDQAWVATVDQGLQRWDGGSWSRLTDPETFTLVRQVDGLLLAASADRALWRSEDEGETWTVTGKGLEAISTGLGSPPDGRHYHELVSTPEGLVLASWEGLFRSQDEGQSWFQLPLVNTQTFWKTDLYAGPEGELRVVLPGYGGTGLSWVSELGERGFMADNQACCPRTAELSEDFTEDGQGWLSERGNAWTTSDGGTWRDVTSEAGLDYVETVVVASGSEPSGALVGVPEGGSHLSTLLSEDAGASFYELSAPEALAPVLHGAGFDDEGRLWLVAGEQLAVLRQSGLSLELMSYAPHRVGPLVVDGEDLWAASVAGLLKGDTRSGQLSLHSLEDTFVADVLPLPDKLIVSLPDRVIETLDDGGTWRTLWVPPSTANDLEALGDWLVAATASGVYASDDGGQTWALASNSYRMTTRQQQWRFGAEWDLVARDDAHHLTVSEALGEGAMARLDVDAATLGVRAVVGPDQGQLEVRVDGDAWRQLPLQAEREGIAQVWCEELEPGWHVLELRAEVLPVSVDAVDVRVGEGLAGGICEAPSLDSADTGEPGVPAGRCGCASSPGGTWSLLGLLGLALYGMRSRSSSRASALG